MCGITGVFEYSSRQPVNRELLIRMRDSMSHRGPDGKGIFLDDENFVGLAHRRLSIIDISGGAQPMASQDGSIWIVFNGEIYNFHELRTELEARGYKFVTNSDTETIIYSYAEYGESVFRKLKGIFSLAIFDKKKKTLVLARDHFGVKPMYYAFHNGRLLFGSEIKAILSDTSFGRRLNFEALNTFLTLRYNPSPQTLFEGVKKLPPGFFLKVGLDGNVELRSYWNNNPIPLADFEEERAIRTYQSLLQEAVAKQMLSDVPVGLMLSGGVDSAVIGRIMQDVSRERIMTFTVGFEGKGDFNELDDARESARYIGSEHFEVQISQEDYLNFFYRSFFFTEEPIAETTIPALYYVSKLAASRVKVVLAGQGADEPLAGYKRYFGEKNLSKYGNIIARLPLQRIARFVPRNERFKRALYSTRFRDDLERFLAIMTIFTPAQKAALIRPEIAREMNDIDLQLVERVYKETGGLKDSLAKILYIDARMLLPDDLLLFGDKMTMANSLEMRVPFLDLDLVGFLETLPSNMKLRGRTHKYIHKRAVTKWLPEKIIHRKKRAFATPMDKWLQNDLGVSAKKMLKDGNLACAQYFNVDYIGHMIDRHINKRENYQKQLFALLSFEAWHKTFFDNRSLEDLRN